MVGVEGVLSMVAKVDPGPCCLEFGQGSSLLGPSHHFQTLPWSPDIILLLL